MTDEAPRRGTLDVLDEELLDDEDLWRDDDSGDHAGWWCVRTDPFPCPADGCTFVAEFMTAAHLVLVWQERDDPNLLWHANRISEIILADKMRSQVRRQTPAAEDQPGAFKTLIEQRQRVVG